MTDDIIRKATTADYIETIDNLRAEVERLRSEIMQPVETFGTPELVAWIEELHHMVMDFPESERGQIPFVMGMGDVYLQRQDEEGIVEPVEDRMGNPLVVQNQIWLILFFVDKL